MYLAHVGPEEGLKKAAKMMRVCMCYCLVIVQYVYQKFKTEKHLSCPELKWSSLKLMSHNVRGKYVDLWEVSLAVATT